MKADSYKFFSRNNLSLQKRYLSAGTFFIACKKAVVLFFISVLCLSSKAWADSCSLTASQLAMAQKVKVEKVIDGDTLRLVNGKLVRFIGVNTPEIDHKFGKSQPFAEKARNFLQAEVTNANSELFAIKGAQETDRHGRLLLHVFSTDGQNIQAELLNKGYGVWIVVPPNLQFRDCYRRSEKVAYDKKKGVWGSQFLRPRQTSSLTEKDRGFQWIEGKISKIARGKKNWWLNFEDKRIAGKFSKVTLRVFKDDLQYFNKQFLNGLLMKVVRVKGWLSQHKKQLVMTLRHPDSIEIVQP